MGTRHGALAGLIAEGGHEGEMVGSVGGKVALHDIAGLESGD